MALAATLACAWPPAASADQTVVSATIYPSSAGSVSHVPVGLQALEACPEYSGSNPIYLYPPGQPFQLTPTSWPLSTVLSCGLQIPLDDVTNVQILSSSQGFEAPLSNADLTDPASYQDPQAPDALPVISVDGTENQTTYVRPFRGGADVNARDEVTETGAPITLVVYANGPPLIVHASARTLSSTATTAGLSATVQTGAGAPVPASALTWSWSFGDGGTSTAATPRHRFAAGSYEVTVQVTDVSGGTGGTATIQFRTPAKPASGHANQNGGTHPTKSKSPTGTENGKHSKHQGGQTGSHRSAGSSGARSTTTSPQPTTTAKSTTTTPKSTTTTPKSTTTATQSTTSTSSATTPPAGTTTPTTATGPPSHRTAPRRRTPAARTVPTGSLVSGRLISDVTTLPAGSSPLVHLTPAVAAAPPQVRQATQSRSLAAPAAALAVAVLLGSGAWWELRGRRRSRAVLPGH